MTGSASPLLLDAAEEFLLEGGSRRIGLDRLKGAGDRLHAVLDDEPAQLGGGFAPFPRIVVGGAGVPPDRGVEVWPGQALPVLPRLVAGAAHLHERGPEIQAGGRLGL